MTETQRPLPAEYTETPCLYLGRRLSELKTLTAAQRQYLRAVLAGLRVTESPLLCDQLERQLDLIPVLN